MKILLGNKWNVDFDAPIRMSEDQRRKFINFIRTLFSVVEEIRAEEYRSERLGDRYFFRKWTYEEYAVLADITKSTSTVADELGRSWMSVDIKRGTVMPDLLQWAFKNNKDLLKGNIRELVKEFLAHKQYIKKKRRNDIKRLSYLESEESAYSEAIKRLKHFKSIGMFGDTEYKKKVKEIEAQRQERLEEIEELKERLNIE